MSNETPETSMYERGIVAVFELAMTRSDHSFEREELNQEIERLTGKKIKNLGDAVYTYRFRKPFPDAILRRQPEGKHWVIKLAGPGRYRFVAVKNYIFEARQDLITRRIPDSTPSLVREHALSDEQALLALIRYNRLIDLFTGQVCYSLQNHLRTQIADVGQIETDEVYVGVSVNGEHSVMPVQAKGKKDKLSCVQIEQDLHLCSAKFSTMRARPIGAQFLPNNVVALMEFTADDQEIVIIREAHYQLVPASELTPEELQKYARSPVEF